MVGTGTKAHAEGGSVRIVFSNQSFSALAYGDDSLLWDTSGLLTI